MKILQVKKSNFYDIFTGIGWKNHTRVFHKGNHVTYINGNKLKAIQYVEIVKSIGG